jgi:RNAse (barnase) inhibitor barstar
VWAVEKAVYEIDGRDFATLGEFFGVVSRVLIPAAEWGHNLSAFDDILYGEFGTPEGGFVLRWKNASVSRERLGYPETVRQLELRLTRATGAARRCVAEDLEQARQGIGPTVFDWLVDIIESHGGPERQDGVELILVE